MILITPSVNMSSLSPGLVDDDVTDDFACAKLLYERYGFSTWYEWLTKCQPPPDVTPCYKDRSHEYFCN